MGLFLGQPSCPQIMNNNVERERIFFNKSCEDNYLKMKLKLQSSVQMKQTLKYPTLFSVQCYLIITTTIIISYLDRLQQ